MSEGDSIVYSYRTVEEAVALVKQRKPGRWYYIVAGQFAPLKGEPMPTNEGDTTKGYRVSGIVRVSKRQALKYIEDAYGRSWAERVNIKVGVSNASLFIGTSP